MKKQIVILALIIFVIGCNKEDDKPSNVLVGTWVLSSYTAVNCDDSDDNESTICTSDCESVKFNSNNTGSFIYPGDAPENFTYTISGNSVTVCDDPFCQTLTFSISGSTLTFTFSDEYLGCGVTVIYKK